MEKCSIFNFIVNIKYILILNAMQLKNLKKIYNTDTLINISIIVCKYILLNINIRLGIKNLIFENKMSKKDKK